MDLMNPWSLFMVRTSKRVSRPTYLSMTNEPASSSAPECEWESKDFLWICNIQESVIE